MPHYPEAMPEEPDHTPRVNFNFRGPLPESITQANLGDEVVVSIRGTVCALEAEEYSRGVTVRYTEFSLVDATAAPKTLTRILEEVKMPRERRR